MIFGSPLTRVLPTTLTSLHTLHLKILSCVVCQDTNPTSRGRGDRSQVTDLNVSLRGVVADINKARLSQPHIMDRLARMMLRGARHNAVTKGPSLRRAQLVLHDSYRRPMSTSNSRGSSGSTSSDKPAGESIPSQAATSQQVQSTWSGSQYHHE